MIADMNVDTNAGAKPGTHQEVHQSHSSKNPATPSTRDVVEVPGNLMVSHPQDRQQHHTQPHDHRGMERQPLPTSIRRSHLRTLAAETTRLRNVLANRYPDLVRLERNHEAMDKPLGRTPGIQRSSK